MWTDQTIRQDDLGDGHAEASDQYLNELKQHPRRRLLKDKVLIGKWERRKRCPEPCERHDLLVEEGREPSLPSGQRKKSTRRETWRESLGFGSHAAPACTTRDGFEGQLPRPARQYPRLDLETRPRRSHSGVDTTTHLCRHLRTMLLTTLLGFGLAAAGWAPPCGASRMFFCSFRKARQAPNECCNVRYGAIWEISSKIDR